MKLTLPLFLSILLPVLYLLILFIYNDPDILVFLVPYPLDIFYWMIVMFGFLFGGWVGATIIQLIILYFLGKIIGNLLTILINRAVNKR